MKIKIVGWDMDGIIIDTAVRAYQVTLLHIESGLSLRRPPSPLEYLREFELPHFNYVRSYGTLLTPNVNWTVWQDMVNELGPAPLHKGVAPLLERFARQEIPSYVVSANRRENVHVALERCHVLPFFCGVFAGSMAKEKEIAQLVADRGIRSEEMIYIGDMRSDMRSAKAAGVVGIGIGSWPSLEKEHCQILKDAGATYVFPSITAFHDALIRGEL